MGFGARVRVRVKVRLRVRVARWGLYPLWPVAYLPSAAVMCSAQVNSNGAPLQFSRQMEWCRMQRTFVLSFH